MRMVNAFGRLLIDTNKKGANIALAKKETRCTTGRPGTKNGNNGRSAQEKRCFAFYCLA
jgi:hypothetical protein